MRSSRIRSLLVTAVVLVFAGLGWFYLAPTQIGGSTSYMITHGISMEPLLHTGDLVLVRPASSYHVGEVVAYHSTLLHTVVLHRIISIHDGHYTFKGENNDFIDPTHPTRALLVGRMWLHIKHGGEVLDWLHKPWVAAGLTGGVAMLLLFGGDRQRRRRRRRRGAQQQGGSGRPGGAPSYVANRALLVVSVTGAVLFAALGVFALLQPSGGSSGASTPYTQQLSFGYQGPAKPGSVYPSGTVTTGDPVYLQLVHQLTVTATYRFTSAAPAQLHGTLRIRGTLSNSSGWSRSFWLGPPAQFTGDHGLGTAHVDLSRLEALTARVISQIGAAGGGDFTLAIVPQVRLAGTLAGAPLATTYSAPLDLALGPAAVVSGTSAITTSSSSGSSTGAGSSQPGLVRTSPGSLVSASSTAPNKLDGVPVKTVRWIAVAGFALFALLALLAGARATRATPDPVERINSRYKNLIVPVASVSTDPAHPPIEVRTIEALAQLAERSERLILHDHQDDVDNYLIDDQGTLFRFQALRVRDTNGNGNGNGNGKHVAEPVTAGAAAGTATSSMGAGPAATGPGGGAEASGAAAAGPADQPASVSHGNPLAATEGAAEPAPYVNGMAPLNDPVESAQAIRLSPRVNPDLLFDSEPRRPPAPHYTHWTRRPEVRVGFTLAPLLTLLAWRQVRSRRAEARPNDAEDPPFPASERKRGPAPRPQRKPPRGPGDRRRGDRRRN